MASLPTITEPKANARARAFTLKQRIALSVISCAGYMAARLIGSTLRWRVEFEEGAPDSEEYRPAIFVFWHRCVLAATWRYRNRGLAVMTSSSFDGEYIARIIEKCGYVAVRGSSTRGGARALLAMHKIIDQGHSVVFTIDGPRGPRYVAKPGPVLLARNTGLPICAFHIALEKAWVLNSWDRFMLPKPFSRALIRIGPLIRVPCDCSGDELEQYQAAMQKSLDCLRETAEKRMIAWTGRNA